MSLQRLKTFFESIQLMKGFQKCARNLISMIAFCGQNNLGQKFAAGWAGLAALSCTCSISHSEISISGIFLQSILQVDLRNVAKCWEDFLCHSNTLETYREEASKKVNFKYHISLNNVLPYIMSSLEQCPPFFTKQGGH